MSKNPIQVYPWDKAPEELKELSTNGGDEDWIIVGDSDQGDYVQMLAERLQVCDYQLIQVQLPNLADLPSGWVAITCHA